MKNGILKEYLAANSATNLQVLINDNVEVKEVNKLKYLAVFTNKSGLEWTIHNSPEP